MRKKFRSGEVDEVDDWFDTLVKGTGFGDTEDYYEAVCNALIDQMNRFRAGEDNGDEIDAELLEPELRTAIIAMVYHGRSPQFVPYHHIRHALENPVSITVHRHKGSWKVSGKFLDIPLKARQVIKGPLRGIRAKCIECQGGSLDLVRSCPTVNCFLWPFRMATNPFFSRLVAHSEQGDNEDAFEGDAEMALADAEFEREEQERLARMTAGGNSQQHQ